MTTAVLSTAAVIPAQSSPVRAAPILIIDDNPAKRLALRAVLAPLGFVIVEADSGAAGLRCLLADDFAVILLDVRMPLMDGFETATMIRLRRESELTPIIFLTAQAADEVGSDRYTAGAVDFITAPVNPDELRAKVSALANLYLQARANAARACELKDTADQLRLLTDSAPIGIFQTDARNRYSYTNARWTEITGVPAAEAAGTEWSLIVDAAQREATLADFRESYVPGEEFSSRIRITHRGGAPRIGVITSRRLLDETGRLSGWVGTLADITAEAGAEAAMTEARDHAAEASRIKSDFLANMSHEMRTPMSGVIGWAELLLETDLDVRQRPIVQSLKRSGESLMGVINDILDFSKVDRGLVELEDIEFNPRTIVDHVTDLLSLPAEAKGLDLAVVFEDSVPDVVCGDPNRLRQVLTNLTSNAIKFTEAGAITIRVTAATSDGSDPVLRFAVSDTGLGIAPEKVAMIFDPFTQADTSTTRKYGGTGLGLAISTRLVALMGGEVGVLSEVGVGSSFWFTTGASAVAGEASAAPSQPANAVASR